jgi:uncharacterized membrane protein YdjX (TVP38/TMEM64 family)
MRRFLDWRIFALLAIATLAVAAFVFLPELRHQLAEVTGWMRGHPLTGALLIAAIYIPATVLFVPGSMITLVAGYALGLLVGTVAVSVGSTLGACAAFWAGRTFARGWVEQRIGRNPRFRALDEGVAREGFKIVLLLRLSPAFPFNLLNYALGLTRVRFRDYALASWLGMLPGTVMYVYLGTAIGEVSQAVAGEVESPPVMRHALFLLGLVTAIAVTVLITRIARNALRKTSPALAAPAEEPTDEPAATHPPRG